MSMICIYLHMHPPSSTLEERYTQKSGCHVYLQTLVQKQLHDTEDMCKKQEIGIIRSAQDVRRMTTTLANNRKLAKMTMMGRHTAAAISIMNDRRTGLVKFGTTPGGGAPAGMCQTSVKLSIFASRILSFTMAMRMFCDHAQICMPVHTLPCPSCG